MRADWVKLRVRFVEGDHLPAGEGVWAEPVDANDGGGLYRLLNSSFIVPLAAGDLVRAQLDGHGRLQVADVVEPSARTLTVVGYPDDASDDDITQVSDGWASATGASTERASGMLYTVWPQGTTVDRIARMLAQSIGGGDGWSWVSTWMPRDRARDQHRDVDFEVDLEPPPMFETDYWAPEDPEWAARGVTDAERLARIQMLASEDPRVLRSLEHGGHDIVLACLDRLSLGGPPGASTLNNRLLDEP